MVEVSCRKKSKSVEICDYKLSAYLGDYRCATYILLVTHYTDRVPILQTCFYALLEASVENLTSHQNIRSGFDLFFVFTATGLTRCAKERLGFGHIGEKDLSFTIG